MELNPSLLKIDVIQSRVSWRHAPDTEVKVTYIPTGFSVRCNTTRSRFRNKQICLKYIKSYLKGLTNVTSS